MSMGYKSLSLAGKITTQRILAMPLYQALFKLKHVWAGIVKALLSGKLFGNERFGTAHRFHGGAQTD